MPIEGGPGLPGDVGPDGGWPARPLPARIEIDGRSMLLRPGDTATLLRALSGRNWMAFVPGLLRPRDMRWLSERLDDPEDPLDLLELSAAAQWCAAHVCQLPWWSAVRLAATARVSWGWLYGSAVVGGCDLLSLEIDQALAVVWAFLRERRENTKESIEELTGAVYDSGMAELELASRVAPASLASIEAQWAEEAAMQFTGMDGVWNPMAG